MNEQLEQVLERATRKDIIDAMKQDRAFAEAVFDLYEEFYQGFHHTMQ
jgi:hypothetical protein